MEKIGVFCSASDSISEVYFDKAEELGRWMGKQKKILVYGGANLGLMKAIAQAVKLNGGKIIGVVPSKLEENGKVSELPDDVLRTSNLSDRKDLLLQESDIMIALPGGIGTLDEIFHVMASSSIGYHSKKIVFYNVDGFYDVLLGILGRLYENQFARHPLDHYFCVANTFEELTDILTSNNHD